MPRDHDNHTDENPRSNARRSFGARLSSACVKNIMVWLGALAALTIYLMLIRVARKAGFGPTRIPETWFQLLDVKALTEHPWKSLLLLHSQPPLLNALLAVLLKLEQITGYSAAQWANALFLLWGAVGALLQYDLVRRLSGSILLGLVTVAALLSNPMYHHLQSIFFYPFLLHGLMLLLIWIICYFDYPRSFYFPVLSCCAVLLLVVNLRSLFHPAWAYLFFALLIAGGWVLARDWTRRQLMTAILAGAILVIGCTAWPLKNYFVFGRYTFSSWSGYNLSRGTPVRDRDLNGFVDSKGAKIDESIKAATESFASAHPSWPVEVVTAVKKPNGALNWNHLVFVLRDAALTSEALRWRFDHPSKTADSLLLHYLIWCGPMYRYIYKDKYIGSESADYQLFCAQYHCWTNHDLRPWIERLFPSWSLHKKANYKSRRIGYSLYAVVLFPLMLMISLPFAVHDVRRRRLNGAAILLCWYIYFFAKAVTCLTDGLEGYRISFSSFPLILAIGAYCVAKLSLLAQSALILGKTQLSLRVDNIWRGGRD